MSRNYWRAVWILLINSAVILLFLTGPIREHADQSMISQAAGTAPPQFSYVHVVLSEPWILALLVLLLVGIIAELRRSALGAIFNIFPYAVWLASALWSRSKAVGSATPYELFLSTLLIIVFTVIVVVDAVFYVIGLRGMRVATVRKSG